MTAGGDVTGGKRPRWRMHDHAIVRSTGFSWQIIDALDCPRTAHRLDELDRCDSALAHAVTAVAASARATKNNPAHNPGTTPEPALSPRQSRRLRKVLGRRGELPTDLGQPEDPELRAALARYAEVRRAVTTAAEAAKAELAAELAETHQAMVKLAGDPAIREALWLSSPSMHDRGCAELVARADQPQSGRARRVRRQFGGYLQRLAAKNETGSFFGPINYADFTAEPVGAAPPRTGVPTRRRAFLAHWAVLAITELIAAHPTVRPHLYPRPSGLLSGVAPTGDPAPRLAGRVLRLDPDARRLLSRIDGSRSVVELAALLDLPVARTEELLEDLVRRRVVLLDCHPPITEVDPLGWLGSRLRRLPASAGRDHWLGWVRRVTTHLTEFATAPLDRRRELLGAVESELVGHTGHPARRGGGQWYADRLAITEECLGSFSPMPLGRHAQHQLTERLAPLMTVLAAEAVARHRALTAAFLTRHPRLRDGASVSLVELLRQDADAAALTVPETRTALGEYIDSRIATAAADQPLRIDPANLPEADLGTDPVFGSPDLMFATDRVDDIRDGTAPVVLAECHDTMLVWGWALQFHPDQDRVRAAGAELLRRAHGGCRLASPLGSRRTKIVPLDLPGPVVDLGASTLPPGRPRIPLADITVRLHGGRLVCSAPGHPEFLLHHGELDSPVHNVLAPPKLSPVVFGRAPVTPRVVLGDVVAQRARWALPPAELFPPGSDPPDPMVALRHARRAASRWGLPRRTFLTVPGERKPVLLDLRAPALLDLGRHLSGGADQVVLTELLPGPDQLWLRDRNGGPHTAELRTTVVLDRSGAGRGSEEAR